MLIFVFAHSTFSFVFLPFNISITQFYTTYEWDQNTTCPHSSLVFFPSENLEEKKAAEIESEFFGRPPHPHYMEMCRLLLQRFVVVFSPCIVTFYFTHTNLWATTVDLVLQRRRWCAKSRWNKNSCKRYMGFKNGKAENFVGSVHIQWLYSC